jgi:hypothetical protein
VHDPVGLPVPVADLHPGPSAVGLDLDRFEAEDGVQGLRSRT